MSQIVELSTGHVFAKGSVKAITPFHYIAPSYAEECGVIPPGFQTGWIFSAIGVGFLVDIKLVGVDRSKAESVRQEAIDKLLGGDESETGSPRVTSDPETDAEKEFFFGKCYSKVMALVERFEAAGLKAVFLAELNEDGSRAGVCWTKEPPDPQGAAASMQRAISG